MDARLLWGSASRRHGCAHLFGLYSRHYRDAVHSNREKGELRPMAGKATPGRCTCSMIGLVAPGRSLKLNVFHRKGMPTGIQMSKIWEVASLDVPGQLVQAAVLGMRAQHLTGLF
jgi:hypothetical protein